ncbi:MAG: VCBS repeat-containing protein [Candidatus Sumerlaeota bacterium]|nr:VCBS repeat-containing protein [Candidatus Sumerlaeota bacterium]
MRNEKGKNGRTRTGTDRHGRARTNTDHKPVSPLRVSPLRVSASSRLRVSASSRLLLAVFCLLSPVSFAAPLLLQPKGAYSFYERDFNGDGRTDVAELAKGALNLYFTPSNGFEVPTKPQMTFPLPEEIALVASTPFITSDSASPCWIGLSRRGIWRLDYLQPGARFAMAAESPLMLPETFAKAQMAVITLDINDDGSDEILTPSQGGLGLWRSAGGKLERVSVAPWNDAPDRWVDSSPEALVFSPPYAGLSYTPTRSFSAAWNGRPWKFQAITHTGGSNTGFIITDFNGDGLPDLISKSEGVYLQKPGLEFGAPEENALGDPWFRFTYYADLDHDGIPDGLLIESEPSLARSRTHISLYRGAKSGNGANGSYTLGEPQAKITTGDFTPQPGRIPLVDFNNDGYPDLMLTYLDLQAASAQKNLEAYFKGGLEVDLRVFLWDPKGGPDKKGFFPEQPNFTYRLKLVYAIFGLLSENDMPIIVDRDFNGDGLPDLVTKTAKDKVALFPQLPKNKGFAARPLREWQAPHDIQGIQAREIDGKPPVDILCLSPRDPEGRRKASVLSLKQ